MNDQVILHITNYECDVCGENTIAILRGPAGHQPSEAEIDEHLEMVRTYHKSECPGPAGRPKKHRVCASQRQPSGGDPRQ